MPSMIFQNSPDPKGFVSYSATVFLFERRPPAGHHFESNRVRSDIAPHIPYPKPRWPPDFLAGQVGTSGPFRRADVDLKCGTNRSGRIASRRFCLVTCELVEIEQCWRIASAHGLPAFIPFGCEGPRFRTIRTATDYLKSKRAHLAGRAPITAPGNDGVIGNFDLTHGAAAAVHRKPLQRAPQRGLPSIQETGGDADAAATCPQLRCNKAR